MAPPHTAYQVENFDPHPNEDLICSICGCVFYDPVECQCLHVYCRNCICDWLSFQNNCPVCRKSVSLFELQPVGPIIKNMIMKLTIRCPNAVHGCKQNFALEEYDSHLVNCDYGIIKCNKCQEEMQIKDRFKHERLECNYRLIQCEKYCSLILPANSMKYHNCAKELKNEIKNKKKLVNELKNNLKYCKKQLQKEKQFGISSKEDETSEIANDFKAGKSSSANFINNKIKKFLNDFPWRVNQKEQPKGTNSYFENVNNSREGNGIESDLINANPLHPVSTLHYFRNPSDSSGAKIGRVRTLDEPNEFIIQVRANIGTERSYDDNVNENNDASIVIGNEILNQNFSSSDGSIIMDEMQERKRFVSYISSEMQRIKSAPRVKFTIPNVRMLKQYKSSNSIDINPIREVETKRNPYLNQDEGDRIPMELLERNRNPGMSSKDTLKINCISENECNRNILLGETKERTLSLDNNSPVQMEDLYIPPLEDINSTRDVDKCETLEAQRVNFKVFNRKIRKLLMNCLGSNHCHYNDDRDFLLSENFDKPDDKLKK
ncbi:uncharacterized protein LOC111635817 [Centruroides sculpturatus]|uniref:uncharacterized protein LOC111635817 n=1 Tax=Centruroides sculpturatus TaxID=218467 RepID=UPI000C6EA03C|nr:uncharacterized protein LOC111635817 [Centruroides sculpturatus]